MSYLSPPPQCLNIWFATPVACEGMFFSCDWFTHLFLATECSPLATPEPHCFLLLNALCGHLSAPDTSQHAKGAGEWGIPFRNLSDSGQYGSPLATPEPHLATPEPHL